MKTKEQIAKEIISLYKTKAQIKRMKETIKGIYKLDNKQFADVEKTAKIMIDNYIGSRYNGAISNVKNGRLALLDAFKRACKDGKFCKELKNYDIEKDIDYIINRFYKFVDIEGNPCKKVFEYAKNEDGTIKTDKDGKRIVLASWYELLTINAFNANSVVVACLNKMKSTAKKEENLPERWNLVKVGRE